MFVENRPVLYSHSFHGVIAQTGDILFTRDGMPGSLFGEIWRLLGQILPGDLDHVALYLGPGVRFIESAANGVEVCEFASDEWNALPYAQQRLLVDELVAIADPLAGRGLTPEEETRMRQAVVAYCLTQVARSKPYNLNVFNPETDGAFYCSQLIYKAYQMQGIDLHEHVGAEAESILAPIVLPKDIWNACLKKQRIRG
jgi:uncharacterized protein YycO